jgi:hypothetical protein
MQNAAIEGHKTMWRGGGTSVRNPGQGTQPHLISVSSFKHILEVSNIHVTLLTQLINDRLKLASIHRCINLAGDSGVGDFLPHALQFLWIEENE